MRWQLAIAGAVLFGIAAVPPAMFEEFSGRVSPQTLNHFFKFINGQTTFHQNRARIIGPAQFCRDP